MIKRKLGILDFYVFYYVITVTSYVFYYAKPLLLARNGFLGPCGRYNRYWGTILGELRVNKHGKTKIADLNFLTYFTT